MSYIDDKKSLIEKINDLQRMLTDEREEYKDIYFRMKNHSNGTGFEIFYLQEENKRLTNDNMILRERLANYEQ